MGCADGVTNSTLIALVKPAVSDTVCTPHFAHHLPACPPALTLTLTLTLTLEPSQSRRLADWSET